MHDVVETQKFFEEISKRTVIGFLSFAFYVLSISVIKNHGTIIANN